MGQQFDITLMRITMHLSLRHEGIPKRCAVSIIFFEHSLIYLNKPFLQTKFMMRCKSVTHTENNQQTFRTRKSNSVACFILFMMVVGP